MRDIALRLYGDKLVVHQGKPHEFKHYDASGLLDVVQLLSHPSKGSLRKGGSHVSGVGGTVETIHAL